MYYVESNHEAIIDADTFQKVQKEINCRANHYKPTSGIKEYIFTSKIECGICGKNYRRKIAGSGTKYEKPIWIYVLLLIPTVKSTALQVEYPKKQSKNYLVRHSELQSSMNRYSKTK